jgi:hypothetical protein
MTALGRGLEVLCLTTALLQAGCVAREEPARTGDSATTARSDSTGTVVADTTRAPAGSAEPGALRTVASAPVEGWTGPGGKPFEVAIRTTDPAAATTRWFGTIARRTSLRARTADLGQYPCTSCHLGRRMVLADERITDAHRNIQPVHPEQTGAACSTCHAADNVELLALKSGDRATLDHTYRLCAQCHFEQAEGWAGGGHGKRLDGWQGRRVVMGCADCHDPHAPAVGRRIPFRAPVIGPTRSHEP